MDFTDEEIQQARKMKQAQTQNVQDSVVINEEEYHFIREMFFDDKLSILLPKEFVHMPLELAKHKYPMEQRPEIIKTSNDTATNFAFSLLPQKVDQEQLGDAVKQFRSIIKRMQPSNRFFDIKLEMMENIAIGWFDFKSPGLDEQVYTMMAFAVIDDKLFHGIFSTAYRLSEEWKPIAVQVFCSLEDETIKK